MPTGARSSFLSSKDSVQMSLKPALLAGALFHLALASAAIAAADCPPLGRMPNYDPPAEAEMRA
jgi:hypothetical protein